MRFQHAAIAIIAVLMLGGCATYDYRGTGAGGGYYSGRSVQPSYGYGAVYGSASYGYYGGYGYGGYGGYGYSGYNPYWSGYYPRPVYRPPVVIVQPGRPGYGRPPAQGSRPSGSAPWRNLQGVQREAERDQQRPSGVRPAVQGRPGQARPARPATQTPRQAPVRPATPVRPRPAGQIRGQTTPVRAAPTPRQSTVQAPLRVAPTPAAQGRPGTSVPVAQAARPAAQPRAAAAPVRQPMRVNAIQLNARTEEP